MTEFHDITELPSAGQTSRTSESWPGYAHPQAATERPRGGRTACTREGGPSVDHHPAVTETLPGEDQRTVTGEGRPRDPHPHPEAPDAPPAGHPPATPNEGSWAHHPPAEPHPTVAPLVELGWRRTFLIRQRNAQENAAKALIRRFLGYRNDLPEKDRAKIAAAAGKLWSLVRKEALDTDDLPAELIDDLRTLAQPIGLMDEKVGDVEKKMAKLAKATPAAWFVAETPGLSLKGLAILVAEAGDLGSYPDKHRLWKRLGLTPYGGHAYSTWRRGGGERSLTAEEWVAAGYSPGRRSLMYANLFLPQTHLALGTPYAAIYYARKAKTEIERPEWTKAHRHMDAIRVATKALVKDIRKAWRRAGEHAPAERAGDPAPAATPLTGEESR